MILSIGKSTIHIGICALLIASGIMSMEAGAEEATPTDREESLRSEMDERAEALAKLQETINVTREREQELASEVEALENSRTALNEELIATAQRARELEETISESESRIDQLLETEEVIRLSLIKRREVLGEVLATLQLMGRSPPPALLVKPEDVLSAIRSAMLVGAVLPDVREKADRLARDLQELVTVRAQTELAADNLRSDYQALSEEQTRLALLVEERRREVSRSSTRLAAQQQRALALAEEADSLRDLIGSMESEIESVRAARQEAIKAAEDARRAAAERAAERTREAKIRALGDQGRIAPAIPFEEAKGLLPLPVSGGIIVKFGEDDGSGDPAKGLSIAARPESAVISPADGWIVYAGPFRSYGQLVIVNAGEENHIVLAGMEQINVEPGQFVLSGEPIATMGSRRQVNLAQLSVAAGAQIQNGESLTDSNVTDSTPVLYVEFRRDGLSIDPSPWWVVGAATSDRS